MRVQRPLYHSMSPVITTLVWSVCVVAVRLRWSASGTAVSDS